MAQITMKRIDGAMVTPKDDACLYERAIGASGMMYGADISYLGASQVHIRAGKGIYKGRDFDIAEQTINVQLSDTGEKKGRIYIHIDLSNAEKPIDILSIAANTLPPLVESDNFNETMGTGEMELATYTAGEVSVTNLTETFVYIGNPYEKMKEMVGELEGDINKINQNLTDGGKIIGYDVREGDGVYITYADGADTVTKKLGSDLIIYQPDSIYVVPYDTIQVDLSAIEGYEKFTADNIYVEFRQIFTSYNSGSITGATYYTQSKQYNQKNGIFTYKFGLPVIGSSGLQTGTKCTVIIKIQ